MSKILQFISKITLKKIVLKLDDLLLGSRGFNFYSSFSIDRRLSSYKKNEIRHGYSTQYKKHDNSLINQLCDKYGSDKGEVDSANNPYVWDSHNYADIYELMFRLRRNDVNLVIECGLGTNNPEVYSIQTFGCDQTNQVSISNFINNAGLTEGSADIIIDDGLHEFHAGKSFFEGTIKCLSNDGIYVIEDVNPLCFIAYKDYFLEFSDKYSTHFFNLTRPNQNIGGNRLIVVRKNPA